MSRPAASTARSATLRLSQRTKKKPRMTSSPHRLYIRLLASSPKPNKRCVIGVTMVWERWGGGRFRLGMKPRLLLTCYKNMVKQANPGQRRGDPAAAG